MSIEKALEKEYGKEVFFSGDFLLEEKRTIVPISPALDVITGGLTMGNLMLVTGKQKLGKTNLCLCIARNAQQFGIKTYFIDVEARLKPRDLKGINELKLDKENFEVVRSQKGNILYADDYIDILMKYAETKENCIFIMDSFSQLCTKERAKNEKGKRFMDNAMLLLADMTKRLANILPVTNNTLIGITHQIANIGPSPSMYSEASGNKVQYASSIKLKATHKKDYVVGDKQVGQEVFWVCEHTASYVPPHQKATSLLRYGYGIDEEYELVKLGEELGIIEKGGAWYTLPNGEKEQGIEKTRNKIAEDKKLKTDIEKQIKEMLGL